MTLLDVNQLSVRFPIYSNFLFRRSGYVHAVDEISFRLAAGQTLGLVGESGCGKSTVGKAILQLTKATGGEVSFAGHQLNRLSRHQIRPLRTQMQMVFQDPFDSLNPRHTVGTILEEPFIIHKQGNAQERRKKVLELLDKVGLPSQAMERFPHEFSGGQRQRIGIARAIALKPRLIICDEPVSALDVSVQSQILNLLLNLQRDMDLALLFIAHDLAVVKHMSDQIAVMYLGRIVEYAGAEQIYNQPLHPYTQSLLAAIPIPDPDAKPQYQAFGGEVPSPIHPPSGCHLHGRCPYAQERCRTEVPKLASLASDLTNKEHLVACHFAGQLVNS